MKRLLTMVAAAAVLLTPFSASMAQTAADMRLEAYTGTVSVTDAGGSPLSAQEGMRLFDGYGMNTEAESFAWISLDKTKALKLDALSGVKINKAGSKLKIDLLSGKLLCDVSAPLDDSESLEIRTSTTVTGIRGTVLVVKVIDEYTTVIYVLEGRVTVTETNPETGDIRMISVAAGQLATSTARSAASGEGNDVTLRSFTADEVDDFVLDEIDRNPAFAEHLRSTDSAEVLKLLDPAEPVGAGGSPAATPPPTYVNVMITDAGDPASEFLDALAGNDYLNLTVSNVPGLNPGENVDVAANQIVQLVGTDMDMEANDLNNAGTIHVDEDSRLAGEGMLTNSSSDTLNVYGYLVIDGTLVNTGIINIYGLALVRHLKNAGIINIAEGGTLEIHGEAVIGDAEPIRGILENTGDINVSGTLELDKIQTTTVNEGDITVLQDGELINDSNMINNSNISIAEEGNLANGGTIQNDGTITNDDGTITNNSVIINNNGGTIHNDGTIQNDGTIMDNGTIEGNGSITGNPVEEG